MQLAGFLVALRAKGESVEELRGIADVMLEHAHRIEVPGPTIDVVGTGGDRALRQHLDDGRDGHRRHRLRVVKHGNRAASSSSGSADVLEALGVSLTLTPAQVAEVAEQAGITFCSPPASTPRCATRRSPGATWGGHRLQRARPADQPGPADVRRRRRGRPADRPAHRRGVRGRGRPPPSSAATTVSTAHPGDDLHGGGSARARSPGSPSTLRPELERARCRRCAAGTPSTAQVAATPRRCRGPVGTPSCSPPASPWRPPPASPGPPSAGEALTAAARGGWSRAASAIDSNAARDLLARWVEVTGSHAGQCPSRASRPSGASGRRERCDQGSAGGRSASRPRLKAASRSCEE